MSTPNPLIPQGTFQAQAAKGASNVRLAVATIVAIHIVFFGGLLLQGCKRDPETATNTIAPETNTAVATNLSLAPLDTSSLYYPTGGLPTETGTLGSETSQVATATPYDNSALLAQPANQAGNPEAMWQTSNLSTPGTQGTLTEGFESAAPMKEYTIVRGDTLGAIAKRNNTTVSALRKANPNVEPTRIRPGQKLQIPIVESTPSTGLNNTSAVGTGGGKTYTVKSGDNLTRIARQHGVTVSQLRAENNLTTSRINVGQKLKIPAGTNGAGAAPAVQPTPGF